MLFLIIVPIALLSSECGNSVLDIPNKDNFYLFLYILLNRLNMKYDRLSWQQERLPVPSTWKHSYQLLV